ncbi:ABC transporter ATP-binding protein [Desertibaculum subflavum]|uniref:ABC transporter ATP-binding protein n=1 Tax=Desertibaculum subflavum TaxID=2268458 RepID=UPI000E65EDCC
MITGDRLAASTAAGSRARGNTVDLEGIVHRYGGLKAVDDVSLNIEAGEIAALLGPSGCGKTTLLRVIAGFVRQSAGRVLVDGRSIDDLPANRRNVGIVFQNYALFPHMTVAENVAYGLAARGIGRAARAPLVDRFLDVVQLKALKDRLPKQISGGQQQRVALARALAVEPSVLLLDEPFSALDKGLRLDMQIEIKRLQRQFGLTAILVTHDQEEAMSVADRIAVMHKGRVEQYDTPSAVYDRPATPFVNSFIGTTNLLPGRVIGREGGSALIELDAGAVLAVPVEASIAHGMRVQVSARPEHLELHATAAPDRLPVQVGLVVPLGPTAVLDLRMRDGAGIKLSDRRTDSLPAVGAALHCGFRADARPSVFPLATN